MVRRARAHTNATTRNTNAATSSMAAGLALSSDELRSAVRGIADQGSSDISCGGGPGGGGRRRLRHCREEWVGGCSALLVRSHERFVFVLADCF